MKITEEKLRRFIEEEENKIDAKELSGFLRAVVGAVNQAKDSFLASFNLLSQDLKVKTKEFSDIKSYIRDAVSEGVNKVQNVFSPKIEDLSQRLDELDTKRDIDRTEIALEASKIALEGLSSQLPTLEQIEERLPMLGNSIASALEILPEEKKLALNAVKGLREELEKLRDDIRRKRFATAYGVGGSGGGRIVKVYDLSSQLNGVLKTFTLPSFWRVISVVGSSFPFTYRPTVDYTTSNPTITFTSEIDASVSLATGQTLVVIYSES